MNTMLLAECASDKEQPRWWAQALGLGGGVRHRAEPASARRTDGGAQRVAARLGAILDDNWTLIRGHCNSAGRLEHILVGPHGVMTLACTSLHGRVHCDGERWRRDKFDLYNNLVERDAAVTDDPAAELVAASARLLQVLVDQTSIRRVAMALVFTHNAATLGTIRHPHLNMVTRLEDLKTATLRQALSGHPDHKTIDGVVEVIRHAHAHSPRRRGPMAHAPKR